VSDAIKLAVAALRRAADRLEAGEPLPEGVVEWHALGPEREDGGVRSDPEAARTLALDSLEHYQSAARYDFWHPDIEQVGWGVLVLVERATERACGCDECEYGVEHDVPHTDYDLEPTP
jgi:hypothetical protein